MLNEGQEGLEAEYKKCADEPRLFKQTAEGVELRSSRQYRRLLRSFISALIVAWAQQLVPCLAQEVLMRQNKRKGSSTSPTVGRGVARRAAYHRSGAFFFWGIGSALRWPVAALGAAFLPTRPALRYQKSLRPHTTQPF